MDRREQSPDEKTAAAEGTPVGNATAETVEPKPLSPAAKRALAEAEARREAQLQAQQGSQNPSQKEVGGRQGPDPVRFGDWEKGGICTDF